MVRVVHRTVAVIAAAIVLVGLASLPSSGAGGVVTASITSGQWLLSGKTGYTVVIRVANPSLSDGGTTLNYVRITPPPGFTVTGGSANGWVGTRRENDTGYQFDFRPSLSGLGLILPGRSTDFTLTVNTAGVPADTEGVWSVATSADAGARLTAAEAAAPRALTGYIRVLLLSRPTVGFLTSSGKVTSGQDNTLLGVAVTNTGTAAVSFAPEVFGTDGDEGIGNAPAVTIGAGQTVPLSLPVRFGAAGTQHRIAVGGNATNGAGTSWGLSQLSLPYDVQAPVSYSYDGTTPLTPGAARSGDAPTFSLTLKKVGEQAARVGGDSRLVFTSSADPARSWEVPGTPVDVPAGADSRRYTFQPTTTPGDPGAGDYDGTYQPAVRVAGVDGNGARFDQLVDVTTPFAIDNVAPVAVPTLAAEDRKGVDGGTRNDPGQPYVARSGDRLALGGDVVTGAGSTVRDADAKVACRLESRNAAGGVLATQAFTCSNAAGALQGGGTPSYPAGTAIAQVLVTTTDAAGNSADTASGSILVDDVAPVVQSARTSCAGAAACTGGTQIRVTLSEPVTGRFSAGDFAVRDAGNTVLVSSAAFSGSDTVFGSTVVLTLSSALAPDARPEVTYRPPSLLAPPADAPGNGVAGGTVTAADGVAPAIPTVTSVAGKAAYAGDGAFYTNQASPAFGLGNATRGATLSVFADTDGQPGLQPATDQLLCRITATASGAVSCSDQSRALAADASYPIFVQAVDANGNVGVDASGAPAAGSAIVVLDRLAPKIAGFTASSSGVVVEFSERVIAGRDQARDWSVTAGEVSWTVGAVEAIDMTHRRLTIVDSGWNGVASRVGYALDCSPGDSSCGDSSRYTDLAGNVMLNGTYGS